MSESKPRHRFIRRVVKVAALLGFLAIGGLIVTGSGLAPRVPGLTASAPSARLVVAPSVPSTPVVPSVAVPSGWSASWSGVGSPAPSPGQSVSVSPSPYPSPVVRVSPSPYPVVSVSVSPSPYPSPSPSPCVVARAGGPAVGIDPPESGSVSVSVTLCAGVLVAVTGTLSGGSLDGVAAVADLDAVALRVAVTDVGLVEVPGWPRTSAAYRESLMFALARVG